MQVTWVNSLGIEGSPSRPTTFDLEAGEALEVSAPAMPTFDGGGSADRRMERICGLQQGLVDAAEFAAVEAR